LEIKFDFKLNYILVVQSLNGVENESSNDLYNKTIQPYAKSQSITCEKFQIQNKESLFEKFERLLSCNDDVFPLIHFAMHGSKEGVELNNDDKEVIEWKELAPYIDRINIKSKNYLLLVFATCFGAFGLSLNSKTSRAPFYMLVGPPEKLKGYRLDGVLLKSFYEEFFITFNFFTAMQNVNKVIVETGVSLKVVTCVELFLKFIKEIKKNLQTGKTRQDLAKILKEEFGNQIPYEMKKQIMYPNQIKQLISDTMDGYKKKTTLC